MRVGCAALMIAAGGSLGAQQATGYTTHSTIPLSISVDRFLGSLEILLDERLATQPRLGDAGNLWPCDENHEPLTDDEETGLVIPEEQLPAIREFCASFRAMPLRPLLLRTRDAQGQLRHAEPLTESIGRFQDVQLIPIGGTSRIIAFCYAYEPGAGFSQGTFCYPRKIDTNGRISALIATDRRTGEGQAMQLALTLNSAWQTAPRSDGLGNDILWVRADRSRQLTYLRRYQLDAISDQWEFIELRQQGLIYDGETFPSSTRFPRMP